MERIVTAHPPRRGATRRARRTGPPLRVVPPPAPVGATLLDRVAELRMDAEIAAQWATYYEDRALRLRAQAAAALAEVARIEEGLLWT